LAHLVELSGTAEWHEPVVDFAGILVVSPKEFERALARAAATVDQPTDTSVAHRRPPGRVRRSR
jgi:hypothetical protein